MLAEVKNDHLINVGLTCINLQAAGRVAKKDAEILRSGYRPQTAKKERSSSDYTHPRFNEVLKKKAAESDHKTQELKQRLEQLRVFYQEMVRHSGVNLYMSDESVVFGYFEITAHRVSDIEAKKFLRLLYGPRPRVEPIVGSSHFDTGLYLDTYSGEPDKPKDLYKRLMLGETLTMRAGRDVERLYSGLGSASPAMSTIEEELYNVEKNIIGNRRII